MMNTDTMQNEPIILQYSILHKLISFVITFFMTTLFGLITISQFHELSIWGVLLCLFLTIMWPFLFLFNLFEKLSIYSDRLEHSLKLFEKEKVIYFRDFDRFKINTFKIEFIKTGKIKKNKIVKTCFDCNILDSLNYHLIQVGLINVYEEEYEKIYEYNYKSAINDSSLGETEDERLDTYDKYVYRLDLVKKVLLLVFFVLTVSSFFSQMIRLVYMFLIVLIPPLIYLFLPKKTIESELPVLIGVNNYSLLVIKVCLFVLLLVGLAFIPNMDILTAIIGGSIITIMAYSSFRMKFRLSKNSTSEKNRNGFNWFDFWTFIGSVTYGFSSITVAMLIGR